MLKYVLRSTEGGFKVLSSRQSYTVYLIVRFCGEIQIYFALR